MPDPEQPDVVVTMTPEDDIRHQLARSASPRRHRIVVMTHFDFDHCGGNRFFPQADFVVQREHYEYAKRRPSDARPGLGPAGAHYRLIDGDQELLPGIELVVTPGMRRVTSRSCSAGSSTRVR